MQRDRPGSIWALMPIPAAKTISTASSSTLNLKSLVWYVPENFEDAGYEVPETMEELLALSEQMVADGETPWCIGLGCWRCGPAGPRPTGVEDIMLRTQPPEVYDAWVSNEMPFNDPRVIKTRSRPSVPSHCPMAGCRAVRVPWRPPISATPHGPLRLAAGLLHAAARRRSSRPSSPKGPRWASMPISSTSPPSEGEDLGKSGAGRWYADGGEPTPSDAKRRLSWPS